MTGDSSRQSDVLPDNGWEAKEAAEDSSEEREWRRDISRQGGQVSP